MKDFLKYTMATLTGLILAGVIFAVIGIISLVGFIASVSSTAPVVLKDNTVAVIQLRGSMTERTQTSALNALFETEFPNISLQDVLNAIAYAKTAPEVKGIHLDAQQLTATPAALQEIHQALADFKQSGKFITAYADSYTQGTYYLCSLADKVMLNPQGTISWTGMSAETMFYKDLLEKLGVKMQIFKVGTYKSAVEPFVATQMSEANREQTTAYLQSIWNGIVDAVSASRNIPADSLNAYADNLYAYAPAERLVAARLVDTLIYRRDVDAYLQNRFLTSGKKYKSISHTDLALLAADKKIKANDSEIAVYYLEGSIDDATANQDEGIHAPLVCEDLRKLAEDTQVKAVVLRVNSPGGSAFGSEQIWHEVMNLKAKKPVVVSMGGYAASGGYYISCAADRIVAEPSTLTGSIGIFGMVPNLEGLTDKLGIGFDRVSTNRHASASLFRPLDAETSSAVQASVERGYNLFVKRCADGRQLSADSIRKVAEGRVWTGEMAQERGLVDELGGLDRALQLAAEKAKLKNYTRCNYPEPEDLWTQLLNGKWSSFVHAQIQGFLGEDYETMRFIKQIKEQAPVQARMPYAIRLNL